MPKILVAIPTHSGAIDSIAVETLLGLQHLIARRDWTMRTIFPSAAAIPMLRNLIVADFLGNDDEILLMLDSDQGIPAATVMRMIDLEEPFVGCLYPRRRYAFERVAGAEGSIEALLYRSMSFVGEPLPPEPGARGIAMRDGFVRAASVGGGAMLLRRPVFTALAESFPELAGQGFDPVEFDGARFAANWGFFNPLAVGGVPAAEDFSFCERWRRTGGTIWADATVRAGHAGRHVFAGSYADWAGALRSAEGDDS